MMGKAEIAAMVADMQAGTQGPWESEGESWNKIIWSDSENRVCFMAHSNGLNDDKDEANARRIARVPAMEQTILALSAQLSASEAARVEAEARVGALVDASGYFSRKRKSILTDIMSAHSGRGAGASSWMREDDSDFYRDLDKAFDALAAALKGAQP